MIKDTDVDYWSKYCIGGFRKRDLLRVYVLSVLCTIISCLGGEEFSMYLVAFAIILDFFFFPSHRSQLPLPPPTKTPNKYFFVCSGCERSVSSNHSCAVTTVTCDTKHYAAENEFYINVFSCKFLRLEGSIFSCPLGKKRAFILPKKQSN